MNKVICLDSGNLMFRAILSYKARLFAQIVEILDIDPKENKEFIEEIINKLNDEEEIYNLLSSLNLSEEEAEEVILSLRKIKKIPPTYTYMRMIISSLKKIGTDLEDTIIIAQDSGRSWRKDLDKNYKAQRVYPEWLKEQFKKFNEYIPKIEKVLPWHFVGIYRCEADDVASVACKRYKDKEIVLVSSDRDWEMLCQYINVKIFSPISKKYKEVKAPMKVLLEKIQEDKCLEGRTPITMIGGNKCLIKDIKIGDIVAGYNFKTRQIVYSKVLKTGSSNSKERLWIYLDNNKYPLKITPNHRVYTKSEWKIAKKLQKGEIIYKYDELKYMIKTNISHNFYKLGYLHGYLVGDGSIDKYKHITYTSIDMEGLKRIQKYLMDLFNKSTSINIAKKENYKPNHKEVYEIDIESDLKDNFFKYFMINHSNNNQITRRQYYRGFIAGFFDAEGTCCPKILNLKNGEQRIVWDIALVNTNEHYISYIKKCLKLFKIHFKIYTRIQNNKLIYRIELTNLTENINFFILFRPAIKRKYPDLKILSNGRHILKIIKKISKTNKLFLNYNLTTSTGNFFASDCLVHNSDNLIVKPKTEAEFETRKMIVNLLELPIYIETPIKEALNSIVPKNLYLNKIYSRSIKEELKKLYNL